VDSILRGIVDQYGLSPALVLHCVVVATRKQIASPPPPLHELESEVMEEMWRRETATVREVLEVLNRGRKKRAYTTVMTIMRRLDRKGLLTRERSGRPTSTRPC
jgi:hypothetical protein